MDVDGVRTGNPLRDNNYVDDGYRFHDVFHLAHMAHLGWSPVHRALMGRRRLSDPRTAQIQDGGGPSTPRREWSRCCSATPGSGTSSGTTPGWTP